MNNKPYSVLMTLMTVALIGLALWQTYSLIWSDPAVGSASIGDLPSR